MELYLGEWNYRWENGIIPGRMEMYLGIWENGIITGRMEVYLGEWNYRCESRSEARRIEL